MLNAHYFQTTFPQQISAMGSGFVTACITLRDGQTLAIKSIVTAALTFLVLEVYPHEVDPHDADMETDARVAMTARTKPGDDHATHDQLAVGYEDIVSVRLSLGGKPTNSTFGFQA